MDEPRRVAAHTTHSGLPSSGHQGPDESPVLPEAASSLTRTERRWPAPATAKTSVALHSPTKVSRPWRQVYRRTTEGVSLPAGATASPREPTSRPQRMEEAHPVAPASSPGRSPQPAPSGCGGTGEGGPQAIPQGRAAPFRRPAAAGTLGRLGSGLTDGPARLDGEPEQLGPAAQPDCSSSHRHEQRRSVARPTTTASRRQGSAMVVRTSAS